MEDAMQQRIREYLKYNSPATMHDLELDIDGFAGTFELMMPGYENVVLWHNVSQQGIDAITELLLNERVKLEGVDLMAYYYTQAPIDSHRITKLKHVKSPHWWPTVVRL